MAKSMFSKWLGGDADEYGDFEDQLPMAARPRHPQIEKEDGHAHIHVEGDKNAPAIPSDVPELAVDLYQTQDEIVVKALVAGVVGQNLDINLSREMITVTGTRHDEKEVEDDNYYQRELYWGAFSRTIMLPEEVDVDLAEASESHGVLTIRLPKVNKKRQAKLKVRSR